MVSSLGTNNNNLEKGNNMSVKTSVVTLLTNASTAAQAAIAANYNNLITAVTALPDDVDGDVTALQDQVATLTQQVSDAQAALTSDEAALAQEKQNEVALQATIDAVKVALGLTASNPPAPAPTPAS